MEFSISYSILDSFYELRCRHDQPTSSINARITQKDALASACMTALEVTSRALSKASSQNSLLDGIIKVLVV